MVDLIFTRNNLKLMMKFKETIIAGLRGQTWVQCLTFLVLRLLEQRMTYLFHKKKYAGDVLKTSRWNLVI